MTDHATTATAAPTGVSSNAINVRAPSKYLRDPSKPGTTAKEPFVSPPNEWLWNTWTVTHSSLSMWRSAQNVRITYKPHKSPSASDGNKPTVNDNVVEYEKKNGKGGVKSVLGLEKPDPMIPGAWHWRGKGWLKIASSHWEILGWGERPLPNGEGVERWIVTWFAPTLFTDEGIDFYSDRKEGLSKETVDDIIDVLKRLHAPNFVWHVENKLQEVAISLPWKEPSK